MATSESLKKLQELRKKRAKKKAEAKPVEVVDTSKEVDVSTPEKVSEFIAETEPDQTSEDVVQALAQYDFTNTKVPLAERLWKLVNTDKTDLGGIPIVGYSTVELGQVLVNDNFNSVRYAVWKLRNEGKLIDSGIRRAPKGGNGTALVVWKPVKVA